MSSRNQSYPPVVTALIFLGVAGVMAYSATRFLSASLVTVNPWWGKWLPAVLVGAAVLSILGWLLIRGSQKR